MGGIEADKIYEVMKTLDAPFAITSVYLVGGCIRDHILGAPIKDYDIAITLSGHTSSSGFTKWLARTFDTEIVCPTSAATYSGEFDGTPIENYKFKYKGLDIDIIRVMEGTVLEWIDTFPCESSKVYYEFGTSHFSITHAELAKHNMTFVYDADCPLEYIKRLEKKYPSYIHRSKSTSGWAKRAKILRSCS